jgi:hypothetical protein
MRPPSILICLLLACGPSEQAVDTASSGSTSSSGLETSSTAAPPGSDSDVETSGSTGIETGEASTGASGTTTGVDTSSSSGSIGDDTSSSDGGSSTGDIPEVCVGIDVIELQTPFATPVDAATWAPGDSVSIGATLYNSGADYGNYPSIVVESDHPMVTSPNPGNQLFVIFEGQSIELSVVFEADDAIARGTEVTFTIHMASLDTVCPNGDTVEVVATIE